MIGSVQHKSRVGSMGQLAWSGSLTLITKHNLNGGRWTAPPTGRLIRHSHDDSLVERIDTRIADLDPSNVDSDASNSVHPSSGIPEESKRVAGG